MFTLKPLPYDLDALEPYMSAETLDYHFDRHHRGYVEKLNSAIKGTRLEEQTLEYIVCEEADEGVFQNPAQAWNHEFFWHCLRPGDAHKVCDGVADALRADFGSFDQFQKEFTDTALNTFGSGWAWLVNTPKQGLRVMATSNADTPLTQGFTPLLTCDVWEHAYYIDHRNDRSAYLDAFWRLVNWEFVSRNFENEAPLSDSERIVAAA